MILAQYITELSPKEILQCQLCKGLEAARERWG